MAAYAQFGYGYPSASQLLTGGGNGQTTTAASAQSPVSAGAAAPSISPGAVSATGVQTGAISPGGQSQASNNAAAPSSMPSASTCCENGRPIMTDPVSGQTVCSCQYDSARLALSGYSRLPTTGVSVYGTPYPSTDQNPYPSIGVDSSAFYSPLSNPYALKESGPAGAADMSAWTSAGLQPTTGYYPYDPALAAYGYGAGYDLAARRKNATRESTATLKAWLNEHKKNPYPTKGEKIMLAIITKMTLTQVSTWFANARRRLKKENKMTWEPKNKTDDDDDAMVSDDEKDKDDLDMDKSRDHKDSMHHVKSEHCKNDDEDDDDLTDDDRKAEQQHMMNHPNLNHLSHHHNHGPYQHHHHHAAMMNAYPHSAAIKEEMLSNSKNQTSSDCGVPLPASKPKIWSLADTAACKTPPPISQHGAWMPTNPYQSGPGAAAAAAAHMTHSHPATHNPHQPGIGAMMMMNAGAGGNGHPPPNHIAGMNMTGGNMNGNNMPASTYQQSSPAMNNFANSPYSRYAGFLGQSHPYNTNSSIPQMQQHLNVTMQQTNGSGQHQQQQQQQGQQQQQAMGFPEVQTDTPPQTPPNMKLPSVAGNFITVNQINTTGTCFNNNNNNNNNAMPNNNNNQNVGYRSASSPNQNGYIGNFTRIPQHSPQPKLHDYSQQNVMTSSPHQDTASDAFKPFYKSGPNGNGFVSPV